MGAKKIKQRRRRFIPDTERVNRVLRGLTIDYSRELPADAAPIPIWEFTMPLPGPEEADAPIPAIRPELVDPVIIVNDPHVVADIEATGLRVVRIEDEDYEKVLLWMIDKSRDLDRRNIDVEFAIDMGPEIRDRTIGSTLAELAKKNRARLIATGDHSKVIVQMIFTPEDYAVGPAAIEAQYKRLFPYTPQ